MGLRICELLGRVPNIIEMDSKAIIELLLSKSTPPWSVLPQWREVVQFLNRFRPKLNHIYREANGLADSLAN